MMPLHHTLVRLTIAILLTLGGATRAWAGPPLICHPLDIGDAKSLPWGKGPMTSDKHYDTKNLVPNTLELLSPNCPVIVRMETMRRAACYTERKAALAHELLAALQARVLDREARDEHDALAWFDAGYFTMCLDQFDIEVPRPEKGVPGLAWLQKAEEMRRFDPQTVFALALATSMCKHEDGKWNATPSHKSYLRKAVALAKEGDLSARNLVLHFTKEGAGTWADLKKACE